MNQYSARVRFVDSVRAAATSTDSARQEQERELRAALLEFGSDTEDNVACADSLMIARKLEPGGRSVTGLAIKGKEVLIADILNFAEGCEIPRELREQYPELAQGDWDAAMRLATLVLTAMQDDASQES